MSLAQEHCRLRDLIVQNLERDLVGPGADDEVLAPGDLPLSRYISGVLWPRSAASARSDEDLRVEEDPAAPTRQDSEPDETPEAASRMRVPSAVGLTFTVDTTISRTVTVQARGASYEPLHAGDQTSEASQDEPSWKRVQATIPPLILELPTSGQETRIERHEVVSGRLEIHTILRRPDANQLATVTVTLLNVQHRPPNGENADSLAWFQTGLEVSSDGPCFVDLVALRAATPQDSDLQSSALLYRNTFSFAAGHGCATAWADPSPTVNGTSKVWTVTVPRSRVTRARPGAGGPKVSLGYLATADKAASTGLLTELVSSYEAWIETKGDTVKETVDASLRQIAGRHLEGCRTAAARMRAGIELLTSDPVAFEAFQLANRAMHIQRSRQDWIRSGAAGDFQLQEQFWRPFQIAFILINLPSLTDRKHPDREISDLLWFPAGGGKTEAYLGLIAYLIVLRRLRNSRVRGTAVLMRYTLRLLTTQQFERATMLICSLEHLRELEAGRLGDDEFGIGLWVGSSSSPNDYHSASKALKELAGGTEVGEGSPIQLKNCPWCGHPLPVSSYRMEQRRGAQPNLQIVCSNAGCDFSKGSGLPAHVIDEQIYEKRPELVIGTVDKFARTAWVQEAAAIFGRTEEDDIGPDLIVQDELHLIAGPLGSTVGIYETAIDWAAGRDGAGQQERWRPKIVTSTATIRRATEQIRAVFDRDSQLFPPPGLDVDDSFFAEPAPRGDLQAREYVGVLAPGISQSTLMIRTYASLLHTVAESDASDSVKDPYWTLIGYFNSLRVLGSAYLQVRDDIEAGRLPLLAKRSGVDPRRLLAFDELTSRVSSSRVVETLKDLETPLGAPSKTPLDVVLATNMISVGLDVDRLGLMTVMGQPPSSAEYIQATSRVGRKHPGLVVTIFNGSKSRDRSHYENFIRFHSTLYKAVEASSATPFAPRSRDRSLAGVLVSGLRMTTEELRDNRAAKNFDRKSPAVQAFVDEIIRRAGSVSDDVETIDETRQELSALLEAWSDLVADEPGTWYSSNDGPRLMVRADVAAANPDWADLPAADTPWRVAQSMREVDAETELRPATLARSRPSARRRSRRGATK